MFPVKASRADRGKPAPDSMLVNGNGLFNCSMATPARPVECRYVDMPRLEMCPGKSRLRIINVGLDLFGPCKYFAD